MVMEFRTKFIIAESFILALLISCGILNILKTTHSQISQNLPFDIERNWDFHPILDIVDKQQNGKCPESYVDLILGVWKGTNDGCDCAGNENGEIHIGKCTIQMVSSGCKALHALPSMSITKWRGKVFCVKYSNHTYNSLMTNGITATSMPCHGDKKNCGIVDTYGNKLCVKKGEECPVNKIVIKEGGVPKDNHKYKQISLLNGYSLYFTNNAIEERLIIELTLSEGPICLDSHRNFNSSMPYFLLKDFNTYQCDLSHEDLSEDSRFIKLDSYTKQNVYRDNHIAEAIEKMPRYDQSSLSFDLFLFSRPFIGFKPDYLQNEVITVEGIRAASSNFFESEDYLVLNNVCFGINVNAAIFLVLALLYAQLAPQTSNCILISIDAGLKFFYISMIIVVSKQYLSTISYENDLMKYFLGDTTTNFILESTITKEISPMKAIQLVQIFINIANVLGLYICLLLDKVMDKILNYPATGEVIAVQLAVREHHQIKTDESFQN